MKKKFYLVLAAIVVAITAFAAVNSRWVKVSDSCNKCVMNDYERICGKCGGFMESVSGTSSYDNGYIKSDYSCKKCSHKITYKNK